MSLAVRRIDPWNLLWVMPAKGTRCHHTFTFSPCPFFTHNRVKGEKCVWSLSVAETFVLPSAGYEQGLSEFPERDYEP